MKTGELKFLIEQIIERAAEEIAERVAARLSERMGAGAGAPQAYLTPQQAAAHQRDSRTK